MRDSWINDASYLSLEAQTDLITLLLGLTLKLTGARLDNFKLRLLLRMEGAEVVAYLTAGSWGGREIKLKCS